MQIRLYHDLRPDAIPGFAKFRAMIETDNFRTADVRKIDDNLYRARLNQRDRLLFSLYRQDGVVYCLLLEFLPNHAYGKSRFLRGRAKVDESRIQPVAVSDTEPAPLDSPNIGNERFHLLDKILFFDDAQQAVYDLPPPLVLIGSAGSGKTAVVLEKMKQAVGDVLYVSLSSFLVENARNLYYANNYENDDQEVDFLSFRELLETLRVPPGKEITFREFETWFRRHNARTGLNDPHPLFEEFRGVITAPVRPDAALTREEYLSLGVKQSIFDAERRPHVYNLFQRYEEHLERAGRFDPNMLSHAYLPLASPRYDFVVVDEVQDITAIQLYLILNTLRSAGAFLLCGDSNQIVHPNFFSWSKVKTLFFERRELTGNREITRVLHANYRNAPAITELANRVLKLKHARFGSIDQESNYLVRSTSGREGVIQLLDDTDAVKRDLDAKTARSTRFAVVVMHPHQKTTARRWFNTPLVFSIQEAKGLEYDSIILFNFLGEEDRAFREIANGVDPASLESDSLVYARARDKKDKSLEMYKFYINALYVAMTRAVDNLYIVDSRRDHPLARLLGLDRLGGALTLQMQDSSVEEWQREAHRLESQGKQEQADAIRQTILREEKPPWPVLDRDAFGELWESVRAGNRKHRARALECALVNCDRPKLNELVALGLAAAGRDEASNLKRLYRNRYMVYDLKNPGAALKEVERYGVDHRTIFNLTPLMVATRLGNADLVEALIERGADRSATATNGLNAVQMCLETALTDAKYARDKAPRIFPLLAVGGLSIQVESRLVKLDEHLMGLFILRLMFALFYRRLGDAAARNSAFTAKDICDWVRTLPDGVLPERRKRRQYISSILSGNEVNRDAKYNRRLFLRIKHGCYVVNPRLKLRIRGDWVPVHDLLRLGDLGFAAHRRPPRRPAAGKRTARDVFAGPSEDYMRYNLDRFRTAVRAHIDGDDAAGRDADGDR